MNNSEIIDAMTRDFACIAVDEKMSQRKSLGFIAGSLQRMLEFAYDRLDSIVSAYDSGDPKVLKEAVNTWKVEKAGIIKIHVK